MNAQTIRLGVDIGRVIIGGGTVPGSSDTQFFSGDTARMLATPAVPGAFDTLARLVPRFGQVWLISKCGERVQRHTRLWLDHHDFAARTGIPRGHSASASGGRTRPSTARNWGSPTSSTTSPTSTRRCAAWCRTGISSDHNASAAGLGAAHPDVGGGGGRDPAYPRTPFPMIDIRRGLPWGNTGG